MPCMPGLSIILSAVKPCARSNLFVYIHKEKPEVAVTSGFLYVVKNVGAQVCLFNQPDAQCRRKRYGCG